MKHFEFAERWKNDLLDENHSKLDSQVAWAPFGEHQVVDTEKQLGIELPGYLVHQFVVLDEQ